MNTKRMAQRYAARKSMGIKTPREQNADRQNQRFREMIVKECLKSLKS